MNLEDIRAVERLISCGSLSEASRRYSIPKATLSHRLRRLEDELGTTLFDRNGPQLLLTSAGRAFAAHADKIARACEQAADAMIAQRDQEFVHLRVGTTDDLGTNFLAPMALRYLRRTPSISIELVLLSNAEIFSRNAALDCIIFAGDPPVGEAGNLLSKKVMTYSSVLCAAPEYLERFGVPESPEALKDHALVIDTSKLRPPPWLLSNGARRITVHPSGRVSSNDFWMMKLSVIQGHGIGFFPTWFVADEFSKGILSPVLPKWSSDEARISVLYHSHRFSNPHIRDLITFFVDDFRGFFSFPYREQDVVQGTSPPRAR